MATVTLTEIWLNLAADPSQAWSFPMTSGIQSQPAVNVSTRGYAGGNIRVVTQPGRQSVLPVTFSGLEPADRQVLEFTLLGALVWYRDDRSRRVCGVFANPQVTEHQYDDGCDMTLTFSEVTVSEAV